MSKKPPLQNQRFKWWEHVTICITISVGMIFAHKLVGVGIGTVVAVLGVGRVIALFNHFFMKKMIEAAGVEY